MSGRSLSDLAAQMHRDSCAWFPAVHDTSEHTVTHAALGLGGETGEVLDVIKKSDICGLVTTCALHADGKHDRVALRSEIADVLTYLLVLAHECEIDVEAAYDEKRDHNVARWGDPADLAARTAAAGDVRCLFDAVRAATRSDLTLKDWSGGFTPAEVLAEIHRRWPGRWPLVSVIDVADELHAYYGTP